MLWLHRAPNKKLQSIYLTTTTTSVLIPLSWLVGVVNFCFNFLSPSLSIVRILSSPVISFQIVLMHCSHDFLSRLFFRFPVISSSITSSILELMSPLMTWPCHCRRLWIIISSIFTTTPTLSRKTSVDILSTSLTPYIILIIRYSTPRKLASSTTISSHVSQKYNKTV